MRWAVRLIGVISTSILARILLPEDFGLVAMATMAIGLINTFSELGTARLLIRIENPDRSHYDTAWTIIFFQSMVVAGLLFLAAPLAARYFDEPRVVSVIRWLALASVISGFANVGVIDLRKHLKFRTDFTYSLFAKLSVVLSTVPLALYLRSYWALVAGMIAAATVNVFLTYVFSDYRPRPSLVRWQEFVRFSVWVTPSNILHYLVDRLDSLIVGAVAAASQLGLYHLASEISKMATGEIIIPMGRALYPSYAKMVHDRKRLAHAYMNVVRTVVIVCFAVGPGLAIVAEDFVHVLLGEQWSSSVALVRILALTGALGSVAFVLRGQIFVVTGNERLSFWLYAIQLALAAPTLVIVGMYGSIVELAGATTVLAVVFVLIAAANVRRVIPVPFAVVLKAFCRPIVSASMMVCAVRLLHLEGLGMRPLSLTLDVAVGAFAYTSTMLVLWKLVGKPEGPESMLVVYVLDLWKYWRQGSETSSPRASLGSTTQKPSGPS